MGKHSALVVEVFVPFMRPNTFENDGTQLFDVILFKRKKTHRDRPELFLCVQIHLGAVERNYLIKKTRRNDMEIKRVRKLYFHITLHLLDTISHPIASFYIVLFQRGIFLPITEKLLARLNDASLAVSHRNCSPVSNTFTFILSLLGIVSKLTLSSRI